MLEGKTPYVDFFVLDSPLILLLSCVPVKIAYELRLQTGYSIASCVIVFEWLISVYSLSLVATLFLRRPRLANSLFCQTVLFSVAFLNIACVYQFGQIEHLLMLGVLPYIVARWLEYSGKRLAPGEYLPIGLLSGLVILLDPSYWIIPFILEIVWISHFKRFPFKMQSILPIVLITSGLVHTLINGLGTAMMSGYRSFIWPMIVADRLTFDQFLYGIQACPDARIFIYLLIIATLLTFGTRKQLSIVTPLLVSGWLGFAYFIMLCKGFYFQALPMFWCAVLSLSILGALLLNELRRIGTPWFHRFVHPEIMAALVLTACICGSLLVEQHQKQLADTAEKRCEYPSWREVTDALKILESQANRYDKVIVLSDNVCPLYPTVTFKELTPGSRIMWSYHFPILAKMKARHDKTPEVERKRLLDFYQKILFEDIKNNLPPVILIGQTEANLNIQKTELEKFIRAHYVRSGEAQFYSDNVPPREYNNPNFPLWVELYAP